MADGQGRTQLITDFAGENYRMRDVSLPPNVSGDALNCDYYHGTIRKRPGWYASWGLAPVSPHTARIVVLAFYYNQTDYKYYMIAAGPYITTPGKYSIYFHKVPAIGSDLEASETDALNYLLAHRIQPMDDTWLWWERKLPNWHNLIIEPLDVSGTSATAGGSGSLNGVRKYYVVARNSTDGHESDLDYSSLPGSAIVTSDSASSASKYDLADIPTSSDPQVDKIRIYATKTDGDIYYYLADINNGTTTYSDTMPDAGLTVLYNAYRGAMPDVKSGYDRTTPVLWQDRLWALGYEDYKWVYKWSERDYKDGLPIYCLFYPYNYIQLSDSKGHPWDVIAVDDRYLLMAFDNGVFAIVGENPSNYRCIPVVTGQPFYRLCMSENYVYAFGPLSVMRIPRGSLYPAEDISLGISDELRKAGPIQGSQRPPSAWAVPSRKEVWFSYSLVDDDDSATEPIMGGLKYHCRWTLVWSEDRQTWARWDMPIDTVDYSSGMAQSVFPVGAQGHLGLISFHSEDADYHKDGKSATGQIVSSGNNYIVLDGTLFFDYIGLTITVRATDGTAQRRILYSQDPGTPEKYYVSENWDTNPSKDDVYTIGEIEWYWNSPRLALTDDRCADKRTHRVKTMFHPVGEISTDNVTLTYRFDENAEQDKTLDATERVHEVITDDVGKELRLKYAHSGYGESVEIEGIQIELEMQE